jgi:hypothetical protein
VKAVAATAAPEGTQRKGAQQRVQNARGVRQPGIVPAASRASGVLGIGCLLYFYGIFLFVLFLVFGSLIGIRHFHKQTY